MRPLLLAPVAVGAFLLAAVAGGCAPSTITFNSSSKVCVYGMAEGTVVEVFDGDKKSKGKFDSLCDMTQECADKDKDCQTLNSASGTLIIQFSSIPSNYTFTGTFEPSGGGTAVKINAKATGCGCGTNGAHGNITTTFGGSYLQFVFI